MGCGSSINRPKEKEDGLSLVLSGQKMGIEPRKPKVSSYSPDANNKKEEPSSSPKIRKEAAESNKPSPSSELMESLSISGIAPATKSSGAAKKVEKVEKNVAVKQPKRAVAATPTLTASSTSKNEVEDTSAQDEEPLSLDEYLKEGIALRGT